MKNLLLITGLVVLAVALGSCRRQPASSENSSGSATSAPAYDTSNVAERQRTSNEARVYLDQGNQLYQNDQDEEAIVAYQHAIERNPEFAEAYYRVGLARAALDQKKEADEAYKKAIELYK